MGIFTELLVLPISSQRQNAWLHSPQQIGDFVLCHLATDTKRWYHVKRAAVSAPTAMAHPVAAEGTSCMKQGRLKETLKRDAWSQMCSAQESQLSYKPTGEESKGLNLARYHLVTVNGNKCL